MQVAISELRSNLRAWLARARAGDEILVTDRGVPVARLVPINSSTLIQRLERDGVLTRPMRIKRSRATGRSRVRASGPVSDLVGELRR